jgi:hypothetical protein
MTVVIFLAGILTIERENIYGTLALDHTSGAFAF